MLTDRSGEIEDENVPGNFRSPTDPSLNGRLGDATLPVREASRIPTCLRPPPESRLRLPPNWGLSPNRLPYSCSSSSRSVPRAVQHALHGLDWGLVLVWIGVCPQKWGQKGPAPVTRQGLATPPNWGLSQGLSPKTGLPYSCSCSCSSSSSKSVPRAVQRALHGLDWGLVWIGVCPH
jgi:hypothetical protein